MPVKTIEWKKDKVVMIDQTLLPNRLKFIECVTKEHIFTVIRTLQIRGAPAIGVAGAFGMFLGLRNSKSQTYAAFYREAELAEKYLASSRPTARNLFWALERMKQVVAGSKHLPVRDIKRELLKEAVTILAEDKLICRSMGKFGADLISSGDTILTHCNAGALATADFGTALAPMYVACSQGKKIKVYADETRPVLQGARLTAWELMKEGVDVTLICDNMAASLMAKGKIDKVFVGADRIARNGDVANKIGTYGVACLARMHKIPFYVVAPLSTFDFSIKDGSHIIIEERDPDEVRMLEGMYVAPKKVKVYNPAFDVTPHGLVTAIVTEKGIVKNPSEKTLRKLAVKL